MRRRLSLVILPLALLTACATQRAAEPSLAPRAAQAIDPRVPLPSGPEPGSVQPSLQAQLNALIADARAGDSAFAGAAGEAERLAAAAAGPGSESWIAAQQALSAVVAARAQTTRAVGDIDQIVAASLATRGGIRPADLDAVQAAAREASAIDNRQAERIKALQARLGS